MLLALAGCAHSDSTAPALQQRVIVRFAPQVRDPQDPALVQSLGAQAGARLQYLHRVSGGACVYTLEGAADVDAAVRRLQGDTRVLEVERDRRRTPMQE